MAPDELKEAIRRLKGPGPKGVDLSPASTFEALLEQRLREVERNVGELKDRINGLVFVVIGAIIVQVVLGLVR